LAFPIADPGRGTLPPNDLMIPHDTKLVLHFESCHPVMKAWRDAPSESGLSNLPMTLYSKPRGSVSNVSPVFLLAVGISSPKTGAF
jgi:hypothetical protein